MEHECDWPVFEGLLIYERWKRWRGGRNSKEGNLGLFRYCVRRERRSCRCWKESQPTLLQVIKGQFHVSVSAINFPVARRGWHQTDIFAEILSRLKRSMDREGRHILLLLDNEPCHPNQLIDRFWNMKMAFLSKKDYFAHTTSWCWNYQTLESENKGKTYVYNKIDVQKTTS